MPTHGYIYIYLTQSEMFPIYTVTIMPLANTERS
uniref:Uncharacterized protein n=1 Tax=Anguilla anguilla TaxID=7936 RepID=A0A0E9SDC6_ANGAN